jgi:hypothetical protein
MTMIAPETEEVVLRLPKDLVARLNETAVHQQHSVESVVSEILNLSLPPLQFTEDKEFAERIRDLSKLKLKQLQDSTKAGMEPEDEARGRELLALNKQRILTDAERAELDQLQSKGDAVAVTRAAAFWLLRERERRAK